MGAMTEKLTRPIGMNTLVLPPCNKGGMTEGNWNLPWCVPACSQTGLVGEAHMPPVLGVPQERPASLCLVPGAVSKKLFCPAVWCVLHLQCTEMCWPPRQGNGFLPTLGLGDEVEMGIPSSQQAAHGPPGMSWAGRECLDPLQCCLAKLPPGQCSQMRGLSLR